MTKPEKQWQLLLVADDGRIIPFKHIKGIAITLFTLLILLGILCVVLGWRLNSAVAQRRQTLEQLASARHEAARYKSENEIVTAELILAEARMEKAGLPVPKRQVPLSSEKPEPDAADDQAAAAETPDESQRMSVSGTASPPAQAKTTPTESPVAMPVVVGTGTSLTEAPTAVNPPTIDLGDVKIDHNPSSDTVTASLRVSNTGPRSSPVEGWSVVILKKDPIDPGTWKGVPDGTLVDGKLDPNKGKNFKISNYIHMQMETAAPADPSSFTLATVYIFDGAGTILLQKDFPISLKSAPSEADVAIGGDV